MALFLGSMFNLMMRQFVPVVVPVVVEKKKEEDEDKKEEGETKGEEVEK